MSDFLFIGGSKDGKRLEVKEEHLSLKFVVVERSQGGMNIEEEIYNQHGLASESRVFTVYVLSSISLDQAMEMLILNYQAGDE